MATYGYTGPTSDVEKVRLRIGDTDVSGNETTAVFSDEEISYFVTTAGSVIKAAIMALRTILASKALLAKRAKIEGDEIEEFSAKDILAMIESLEEEAAGGGLEFGTLATTGQNLDSYLPSWIPDDNTGIGLD
jgi:hypothetical protein